MSPRPPTSSRDARPPRLSSLRRQHTDTDYNRTFEDYVGESDKGAVILASATLDSELEALLVRHFARHTELEDKDRDLLFGENGPLSSLGAKARLGHAIGLFGMITRDDIILISKIRNAFAHAPRSLDFDNELIIENCLHLRALSAYKENGLLTSEELESYTDTARRVFTFTCIVIPIVLANQQTEETRNLTSLLGVIYDANQVSRELNEVRANIGLDVLNSVARSLIGESDRLP
jgi:DNA-binding MltR family transcriptional regulator